MSNMYKLGPHIKPINANLRVAQYDPTRTITLRNAFITEMNKRFRALRGAIRDAIVTQDGFGLKEIQANIQPTKRAFDFALTQDKVNGFMSWLRNEMSTGILEVTQYEQYGTALNKRWTDSYIQNGYARGVNRGRSELLNVGYNVPSISQSGGLQAVLSMPMHVDRIGVLYSRAFGELKGITSWMDNSISKVLAEGLAQGDAPSLLARKLNRVISGVGDDLGITDTLGRYIPAERRARTLARTEIVRAHHQGTIQEYKNWEAAGVTVQAEWSTAGDSRVCIQCSSLEGNIYSLEQITPMIPVHPNCRCLALPANPKVDGQAQPMRRTTAPPEPAWKSDPVAKNFKSATDAKAYMKQKEKWDGVFNNLNATEKKLFKRLRESTQTGKEWRRTNEKDLLNFFKTHFSEKPEIMQDMLEEWMSSTQNHGAQAFKYAARLVEKDAPKMVFKEEWGVAQMKHYIKNNIRGEGSGVARLKRMYVDMRAMSQSYMQKFYPDKVFEVYRGVQGRTGTRIVDNVYRTMYKTMKRTKFEMVDMPVMGWSTDLYTAVDFGGIYNPGANYGWSGANLTYRIQASQADIFIPRDLLANLFNSTYRGEEEFLLRGWKMVWDVRNMEVKLEIGNEWFISPFDSLTFEKVVL